MSEFNRESAFSISLGEADPSDTNQALISLKGKLYSFSEKAITEIQTAESLDPDNEYPDTRHHIQKIFEIGTSNSLVARTIIQSQRILNSLILNTELNKDRILDHIWDSAILLFKAESSFYRIFSQAEEKIHLCDTIISENKSKGSIPQLPQIDDLENHVVAFLTNSKRFLEMTYKMLCIFYDADDFEANFKDYAEWINKNQPESKVGKLLGQDFTWIQKSSWYRNAVDANHSREGFRVTISNFSFTKGNKFFGPSWSHDFSSKYNGDIQGPTDIIKDMGISLHNMLTFFEDLFLICVEENWDQRVGFRLYRTPDKDLKPSCPVVYGVTISRVIPNGISSSNSC